MLPHIERQQRRATELAEVHERTVDWLGVEPMASFPSRSTSQAHPLPKRFIAASLKAALNLSRSPKVAATESSTLLPAAFPFGAMQVQKKLWIHAPPPVLRAFALSADA